MRGVIGKALRLPPAAAAYWLGKRVAKDHPAMEIIEGPAAHFQPFSYAASGACTIEPHRDERLQNAAFWSGERALEVPQNGRFTITWQEQSFTLYWVALENGPYFVLVAERRTDAVRFFEHVCRFNDAPLDEILVFHAGQWTKDERLLASIADSSFESLVLAPGDKQAVAEDVPRFFASRERYARYAIPWKRGILFFGPPGNGKTHAVKAIVNAVDAPCIYVRSFDLPHHVFPGAGVAMVFERARQIAPCVVVLEDLDALVRDDNRAYFLNELDGFDRNEGILVLATTNHPERIDPAIVDRPSRFDRKYAFPLPAEAERKTYIDYWNGTLDPDLRLSDEDTLRVAAATDGFSFAYLKELFISSLMAWVGAGGARFADLVSAQAEVLRGQLASAFVEEMPPGGPDPMNFGMTFPVQNMMMMRTAWTRMNRYTGG
jgi:hypothetical protein